ncbi:MAG: ferrochelatase, partial [Sulfurospirillaceae bacterium]
MSRGVVLLNMGGPNNLNEVELFLTNMFNDENILTIKSSLLRSFIAKIITLSRKKEATHNYETLGGKSPLVDYTFKLQEKLKNLTNS